MGLPRIAEVSDETDSAKDVAGDGAEKADPPAVAKLRRLAGEMAAATGQESEPDPASEPSSPSPDLPASPAADREQLRIIEAMLFAASEPLDEASLAMHLKGQHDLKHLLATLQAEYATRGVNLVKVAGKWAFRTAQDLSWLLERHAVEERRLSRAGLETLSIIAYHQPVTRAEIEEIRGVTISKGTLDVLLETGWIKPRGRRRAPGKPLTFGTTPAFLEHFGLDNVSDLPGLAELRAAGLLDGNLPPDFRVPEPREVAALMPDEMPLEAGEDEPRMVQTELDLPDPEPEEEEETGEAHEPAGDEGDGEDAGA